MDAVTTIEAGKKNASLMSSQDPSRHSQTDAIFVGFAGHIGAGKTSAAQYLRDTYGFQYTRYSLVLGDWLASESSGREGLQQFGWDVMAGGRQVELNARLIAGLDLVRSVAIDGLRHPIDFHSLSYAFKGSFQLVFLDAARRLALSESRGFPHSMTSWPPTPSRSKSTLPTFRGWQPRCFQTKDR